MILSSLETVRQYLNSKVENYPVFDGIADLHDLDN